MRKVAVIFGGRSCENEISVLTGVFVLNVLRGEKYLPVPVYIHTDGLAYASEKMRNLSAFKQGGVKSFERVFFEEGCLYAFCKSKKKVKRLYKIDAAINCCHGGLGEGGGVSALMEWNGIPLASPDLVGSGIFMDKGLTKLIMKALNIPTLEYIRMNERDYRKRGAFLMKSIEARLGYPVVIKPAHLGSSIGISLVHNETQTRQAIEEAFALDDRVIVEKYLPDKKDVNCAVYALNGEIFVSEAEESFGEGIYTFEEKYIKRQSDGVRKCDECLCGEMGGKMENDGGRVALSGAIRDKIRAYSKTIYKRLNLYGVVRMDFLVRGDRAYLCEVNTVPGSLAYYLFCERITDAKAFFSDLIEDAIAKAQETKKQIVTTGILKKKE